MPATTVTTDRGSRSRANTARDRVGRPTTRMWSGRAASTNSGTSKRSAPVEIADVPPPALPLGSLITGQPCSSASLRAARPLLGVVSPTISRVRAGSLMFGASVAGVSSDVHGAPSARPPSGSGQSLSPSGTSGSRNARLRWTGPGSRVSVPRAAAQARPASARQYAVKPATRSGVPTSANRRTASPNNFTWSMVWLAPVERSSGGRSAVSRSSGTPDWSASIAAGCRFAGCCSRRGHDGNGNIRRLG